jgi:hypothetical protein
MVEYEVLPRPGRRHDTYVTLVFNQAQELVEKRPGMLPLPPDPFGPLVAPLGK